MCVRCASLSLSLSLQFDNNALSPALDTPPLSGNWASWTAVSCITRDTCNAINKAFLAKSKTTKPAVKTISYRIDLPAKSNAASAGSGGSQRDADSSSYINSPA